MSSHVIYTSRVSCPLRCSITNRYMSKSLRSQRFGWLCFYWVFSSNWIMWQFVVHLLSFFFPVAGVFGAGTGWVWVNVEWTYFIWNVCQCISSVNGCHLRNPFIDVPPMKLMSSIVDPCHHPFHWFFFGTGNRPTRNEFALGQLQRGSQKDWRMIRR